MNDTCLLLIDDDRSVRDPVRRLFVAEGWRVEEAETIADGQRVFERVRPDAVLLDFSLPDGSALDLLPRLRQQDPDVPIVILTAHGEIQLAVATIKAGADQFLVKPAELRTLREVLERALELRRSARRDRAGARRDDRGGVDPFVGESRAIRELEQEARIAADAESPLLLLGETGSGKGVLARWLHQHGRRSREAFVDINCAGLSRDLLDSELFGHVRGAFTGAVQAKSGLFEIADRGTLFLDEIGDIDPSVQPKILKVVEERRFRRVGDVAERRVDVRLLAATHRDLAATVRAGSFRADLYYRLNTLTLRLPALRERLEDLPALTESILGRIRAETGRGVEVDPDVVDRLARYSWPGNIRELRNVLERATLFARDGRLTSATLRIEDGPAPLASADAAIDSTDVRLADLERRHIERVLAHERGQVDRTAERLGIPRSTLYQRLKEYGISAAAYRGGGSEEIPEG
ncbi:MAG: sigma-54-dependent Fis family transcriptional regulator [Acidobacteriota bacterium]